MTEFIQSWVISRLVYGNAFILLSRSLRQTVDAMYVLDPMKVQTLLAPNGDVYYKLGRDDLSRQYDDGDIVPASEMIHDKMNTLHHPLIGLSPIYASGLAATLGLSIQNNSANLFGNAARPGGLLIAKGQISQEQADRVKSRFVLATSGTNFGKIAVLSGDMTYVPLSETAVDSELIDQWKATAEAVCSTFHVPGFMVGLEAAPPYGNVQPMIVQYFAQAIQKPVKCIEDHLDTALGLAQGKIDGRQLGVEFNRDDLLLMDTSTMADVETKKVGAALSSPNEARLKFNLPPVEGGETPYIQEQNWPLRHMAARPLPTRPVTEPEPIPPMPPPDEEPDEPEADEKLIAELFRKELAA